VTTRRSLATLAIVVLILVAGVGVLYAVRSQEPPTRVFVAPTSTTPTSSPTPAASVAPSPSPTAAAGDRYGYIFNTPRDRIVVRRERDAAPVFELAGVGPAVSADGKRLAYWRTTLNVSALSDAMPGGMDLRVLEVANPTSDRSVFTVSAQTLGGEVVWSNDGQGLLVATYSREIIGGFPAQYDVLMLDLTSTPPSTRTAAAPVPQGSVYHPVAWDRPGQVAAAFVTGAGGGFATEYVTWNGNAASPFARASLRGGSVSSASADAKLVLGFTLDANGVAQRRVWPIGDMSKAEAVPSPGLDWGPSSWRPGPTAPYELIWTVGARADQVRSLELVPYGTVSSTTLYTAAGGGQRMAFVSVRPDGSGVLISEETSRLNADPPTPSTRLLVVDVATRQVTEIWTTTGYVKFLPRGVVLR
jgi:hypothetical protein